jgi:hypothetical protein
VEASGAAKRSRASGGLDRPTSLTSRVDPVRLALIEGGVIAALGVAGVWAILGHDYAPERSVGIFDLDQEYTVPSFFSASFLCLSAVPAFLLGRLLGARRFHWFGALLVFMGADEWAALHERLESAIGITWQVPYVPIVIGAVVVGILVVRALPHRASTLLLLGAAAWLVAQVFELLEWDSHDKPVSEYVWLMVPEELLEMVGSVLFGIAFLVALRRALPAASDEAGDMAQRRAPGTRLGS